MPKNCINCGCPISGDGKNKIFCDVCLSRVSPFLKFISTSKVPAVKLFDANEAKLRGMGLSDMTLSYLSKCCNAYDEKRAAAAAVPAKAVESAPPAKEQPEEKESETPVPVIIIPDTPESKEEPAIEIDADETPTVNEPAVEPPIVGIPVEEPGQAIDASPAISEPSVEDDGDEDKTAAFASLAAAVNAIPMPEPAELSEESYTNGTDAGDGYSDDEYDEEDTAGGTKRLTLILIAAVLTLIIFLVLYIGKYLPLYSPGDDTDKGGETTTDASDVTDSTGTETDDPTIGTDDTSGTDTSATDTDTDTDTKTDPPETVCEHEWIEATCLSPSACLVCGEKQGEALGHEWHDATCTEPRTCSRCEETEGEALGHDANTATCTEASVCSRCGRTVKAALGHNYSDATCTEAAKCSRCGEVKGEALGHDYQPATCTKPETCSRCGDTLGDPLGHVGGAMCIRCGKYMVTLSALDSPVTAKTDLGDDYTVTVHKLFRTNSDNSTLISFEFTVTNPTTDSIASGGFKVFYVDADGVYHGEMVELWESVNPGESFTKKLQINLPYGVTPVLLEYYPQEAVLAGMSSPHGDGQGAFFWKIP